MRTIILTYPGFQSLPRGLKQLLLATEEFYFAEVHSTVAKANAVRPKGAKIAQFTPMPSLGRPLQIFAGA
jgi:hypothetical protein